MPPRYAYWTIIAGGLPTAFRAAEREELLPTFKRIQEKHPDAEMKYFARGRLWESQEEARREALARREGRGRAKGPSRGPDWRPGGAHRDPRQPFKDAKRARNLRWRKERFEHRQRDEKPAEGGQRPTAARPPREKPQGGPPRRDAKPRRPWGSRPPGPRKPPRRS